MLNRFSLVSLLTLIAMLPAFPACTVEQAPEDDSESSSSSSSSSSSDDASGNGGSTAGSGGGTTSGGTTSGNGAGGSATSGGGDDTGCDGHLDCAADEICLEAACNLAWGREFRITAVYAEIVGSDPYAGGAWDPLGGAPDGYVDFYDAGTLLLSTGYVADSFTPAWYESVDLVFANDGSELEIDVYDYDRDGDDYVTGVLGTHADWLAIYRSGGVSTTTDDYGSTFTVWVDAL